MTMKYVTIPMSTVDQWTWQADAALSLAKTVIEEERKPIDSGLLDAHGTKLYRIAEREPLGFMTFGRQRDRRDRP